MVKGAVIRSKARWTEHGEKNTRYFLNLEKGKSEKKRINKLKLDDGTETEDQNAIMKEEENFYRSLYKSSRVDTETPKSNVFLKNKLIKPLSDESATLHEGKITKEECRKALK